MHEIDDDFAGTGAVLVIGAGETVTPATAGTSGSPLAGLPVPRVREQPMP